MSEKTSIDDRLARWMLDEAPDDPPDHVLRAVFERTRPMRQDRGWRRGHHGRARMVLLAAAVMLLAASVNFLATGAWRSVLPVPAPDALQRVLTTGVVRVAVSPDRPERRFTDGGFHLLDVDLAQELGRRLGVRAEIVELSASELAPRRDDWDVALTSAQSADGASVIAAHTHAWPHLLLVPAGAGATSVDDVRGQPICAVAGDEGERWLLGDRTTGGGSSTPPIPSTLVLRDSDDDCLDLLTAGQVRGVVTAALSPAHAAGLRDLKAIDGPPVENRVAVVQAGDDGTALANAVRAAVAAARADGTLAARSVERLGIDLTSGQP